MYHGVEYVPIFVRARIQTKISFDIPPLSDLSQIVTCIEIRILADQPEEYLVVLG
jgi:hypothetical protein